MKVRLSDCRVIGRSPQDIRAVSARKLATRNCSLLRSLLITKALTNLETRRSVFGDELDTTGDESCSYGGLMELSSSPSSANFQDFLEFPFDRDTNCESMTVANSEEAGPLCFSSASPFSSSLELETEEDHVDILSVNKTPIRCKDPSFSSHEGTEFQLLDGPSRLSEFSSKSLSKRAPDSDLFEDPTLKRSRSAPPCSYSFQLRCHDFLSSSTIFCAST